MSDKTVLDLTVLSRKAELRFNEDGTHTLVFVSAHEPNAEYEVVIQSPLMVNLVITEDASERFNHRGDKVMSWSRYPVNIQIQGVIAMPRRDSTVHEMKLVSGPYGDDRDLQGRKK